MQILILDDEFHAKYKVVPREPTEAMIDAPRGMFRALEMGWKSIEDVRRHMQQCGDNIDGAPDWFKTGEGHLTKAGKADVAYYLSIAAAPEIQGVELPERKYVENDEWASYELTFDEGWNACLYAIIRSAK